MRPNYCFQSFLNPAARRVPLDPARAWLVPDSAKSLCRELDQVTASCDSGSSEGLAQRTINRGDEGRETRLWEGGEWYGVGGAVADAGATVAELGPRDGIANRAANKSMAILHGPG